MSLLIQQKISPSLRHSVYSPSDGKLSIPFGFVRDISIAACRYGQSLINRPCAIAKLIFTSNKECICVKTFTTVQNTDGMLFWLD